MEQEKPKETQVKEKIPKELRLRIISAIILIPIVLDFVYFGGLLFVSMMVAASIVMSFEWKNITNSGGIITSSKQAKRWEVYGIIYIFIPIVSLLWLRYLDKENYGASGMIIIFWLFFLVWAVDTGAYFAGKKIGGPKLAPKISPKKTWAGLFGGILSAALIAVIFSVALNLPNMFTFITINVVFAVIAQAGDLFESYIKRKFGVKDSGHMIPGHGGLLDRVDGLIAVAPFAAILLLITGGFGIFK